MITTDSLTLRQRLHKASVRAAQLEGTRKADADAQARWTRDVGLAKGRLALAEEIGRIFDALQKRAHERSVGAFERLLTAILKDVLPEEGIVRLLTQYKSNATYLDVALEKNGGLEDVLDGNGGAVTNVLCAGLRFAALSRTKNRRLMILDEPDCWLKPSRVPAFVRVISQVALQTQTQTFFITHHDPSMCEGHVNLVRFFEDAKGKVHAEALAPIVAQWENDEAPGLRGIELINFRRHEHTVIPCFPGATAFIGDNNLGKSTAIVSSFKAVAYGESDDTMVRRGCQEARIIFRLEKGRRLEWSRSIKRSPAVEFALYENGADEPVKKGGQKTRNQAPDWVTELLGVSRVDDLDIQVGNQKSPVFLLDETAPTRAQILSIGRESSHLKTLMKQYEETRSSDREVEKQGELHLARLKYRLDRLAGLDAATEKLAELVIESEDMLGALERREQLGRFIERMAGLEQTFQAVEKEVEALAQLPETPDLVDVSVLNRLCDSIGRGEPLKNLTAPQVPVMPELADTEQLQKLCKTLERGNTHQGLMVPSVPVMPELADIQSIAALGQRIAQAESHIKVLSLVPNTLPTLPELPVPAALEDIIAKLAGHSERVATLVKEDLAIVSELSEKQAEYSKLVEDLGGQCPLCNNTMNDALYTEHVHVH